LKQKYNKNVVGGQGNECFAWWKKKDEVVREGGIM
jgi:hypothetical protein